MNIQNAWRFIVAAQDDPVLAAWASVCDGHCPAMASDISPYDAWDAYQYLFNHGFVSSADFDRTDINKQFFNNPPEPYEIREVLDRAKLISPDFKPGERPPPMSDNPFFQKGNSIARKAEQPNGLAERRTGGALGEAFAPRREAIAGPVDPLPNSMFDSPGPRNAGSLQCQDPMGMSRSTGNGYVTNCLKPRCGAEMTMYEINLPPEDELPGDGDFSSILVATLEGRCDNCGTTAHTILSHSPDPRRF